MKETQNSSPHKSFERGQALIEYTLVALLVILAFAFVLAATGPAVGNIFSNTVVNLLGLETPLDSIPNSAGFWGTVTWVYENTPENFPVLATRTPVPPTLTATPGPPPTATPITPTKTPNPTNTPRPTSTPEDKIFQVPFADSADERINWRLDQTLYLGSEGWYGDYYSNTTLSGSPDFERKNAQIDPALEFVLNFRWGSGGPFDNWPAGNPYNNFGAIWRRPIYLENQTTLSFDNPVRNDGLRIWILGGAYGGNPNPDNGGPGTCSNVFSGATRITTGVTANTNKRYDDAFFGFNPALPVGGGNQIPTECLILDTWANQNTSSFNITRTVPPGQYTIQVEYYEATGDGNIEVVINSASQSFNPDDTTVDNVGTPTTGNPNCKWGQAGLGTNLSDEVNSLDWMWEEYTNGDIPNNNRCYLELRGYIDVPLGMTDPVMSFWDFWDLGSAALSGWVEVAEYIETAPLVPNRAAFVWQKIPVHTGSTANYNWTYQSFGLSNVGGVDYRGKKLAIRFVIESRNSTSNKRWFVDDIHVEESGRQDLFFAQKWNLDSAEQANNFITSGRWKLTSRNARGGTGMSFEDSPGTNDGAPGSGTYRGYDDIDLAPDNSNYVNLRHHSIEFKGFIDTANALGTTDLEGDAGEPMLSFWHGYFVARNTGLEVQYTTSPYSAGNGATWTTVPGGVFRSRTATNEDNNTDLRFVEVPLGGVITAIAPATKFRLRFVMTVQNTYDQRDGWWIDDIQLERRGAPKFTQYPFYDPAEVLIDNWLLGGTWNRVDGGYLDPLTGHSYTDSPAGNYSPSADTALELRYPFDMRLDTPENPKSPACSPLCEAPAQSDVPITDDPILTFWHRRSLNNGENIYVEWKRFDEPATQWRTLWAYLNNMATNTSSPSSRTQDSIGWERVEIDLRPLIAILNNEENATSKIDDDVIFRIRLTSNSSTDVDDGIYIDDIRVETRNERIHYLWPASETRDDTNGDPILNASGNPANGSGTLLYEGVDNDTAFFDRWHFGGFWETISWQQRKGLYSFHDAATDQTVAQPDAGTYTMQTANTFNVLEMATIVDLRGLDTSEIPIMYFWSRYHVRSSEKLQVQISFEDSALGPLCQSALAQCYEHLYGWSEWQTLWEVTADRRTYTWQREQVPLEAFRGKRIRIRFVSDALDNDTGNEDGWYIDEIEVKHYNPRIIAPPFFDAARNMQNWVAEGSWGLDPEFFRGGGGGPASLGTSTWAFYYWDVSSCAFNSTLNTCVGNFLDSKADGSADRSGIALDINFDWGTSGPYGSSWRIDRFAGRFKLTTPPVGSAVNPGTYTLITISDDGVRLKYRLAGGGLPPVDPDDPPPDANWNIINNWTDHGRTVDMGTAKLITPNIYELTLEWYERSNKAVIIMTTGNNAFSFTDSPKQGNGPAFPEIPSQIYSNSSLILDGVLDLSATTDPIIQYYTYHELGGTARVEVSIDGGFTWTQTGLRGSLPNSYYTSNWTGTYYNGRNLDFSGAAVACTRNEGTNLNINFGGGGPGCGGLGGDNFSAAYTRTINLPVDTTVTFSSSMDDGIRIWLDYAQNCDATVTKSGQAASGSNKTFGDPATGCLLMDDWNNQSDARSVTRTIPAGAHTIRIDYFEATGGARISTDLTTGDFGIFTDPSYSGNFMPDDGDWRIKQHDLKAYAGQSAVGLRFRLDRLGSSNTDVVDQVADLSSFVNWLISWWITDILVVNAS